MLQKSALDRAGDRIATIVERVLALALMAAILLDFVNVMGRYSGGFSFIGVDELEIYVLIAIAFVGAAAVTWRRQHLRMDVIVAACPPIAQKVVACVEMIVMLMVAGFLGVQSFAYVKKVWSLGAVSDIAGVPMWIPHSAVCVSFFLIAIVVLVRGFQLLGGEAALGRDKP